MASAFTPYRIGDGRVVNIPTKELTDLCKALRCSRQDAVDVWLCDHDYIDNPEEQALTEKAKENRITATIHQAKAENKPKTQRERVVKEDKVKEDIIRAVSELLPSLGAESVVIEKKGKLITFKVGADSFKFDLIRQRPPKENKG